MKTKEVILLAKVVSIIIFVGAIFYLYKDYQDRKAKVWIPFFLSKIAKSKKALIQAKNKRANILKWSKLEEISNYAI